MISEFDDDNTRSQPETVKKKRDREFFVKMIPYFMGVGVCVYAFVFAPMQAMWVAFGFLFTIGIHFGIKIQLEHDKRQKAAIAAASQPFKRTRTAIPYPEDMVLAYMREGRGYWIRHYQTEGMAETQEKIEFAEDTRRVHLRGQCDRKSCYFCHFHDQHAPYV
jgi:hypothetical protein